jgi:MFS family permease
MFIGSIVLFEAASALCGAAPTMDALIIGRAIAGIGGTGIFLGYVGFTKHLRKALLNIWVVSLTTSPFVQPNKNVAAICQELA